MWLTHRLRPQSVPSFVRFCRDYSIADLFFVTFAAISGAYAVSTNSSIRTGLCEEVSNQPDFIRDLADMGFNLENCEVWFERAVIGVMTITAVVIMVRVSRNIFAVYFPSYSARALRASVAAQSRFISSYPSPTITPTSPALDHRQRRQRIPHHVPRALNRSIISIYYLRRPRRHARRTGRPRCTFTHRSHSAACQRNRRER